MQILEGQTVGIDLGTTYSAIAQLDADGEPRILNNADGRPITPSVVLLGEAGNVMVGPSFERISFEDPSKVIEGVKREMGNENFYVVYQGKRLKPEFVSALILKKLKQDAEKEIGPITNAVITVPYYFNDVRRKATQDAGRIAGLNVLDIINEPTAATLSYAWKKGELGRTDVDATEKTILVYDLGGGTFDVTVVRYSPTSFRVLATDGDVMLGGLDWTKRMVDYIAEQFKKKYNEDPRDDAESVLQFMQECETAKRDLSKKAQALINVYHQGKSLTVAMTRGDFERMTADLLQRTKDTTELVMDQAGITADDLDELVTAGGSTYMPVVMQMLRDVAKREPSRDIIPEEAVAQGAAIHAAILEARHGDSSGRLAQAIQNRLNAVSTQDVNSHSLGIKITDPNNRERKINHIMIPKNTPIPHQRKQKFVTNADNQQRIHVYILEGEVSDPAACTQIGDFQITNLPENLPKGSPVEISYEYDANGRIHATAKELTSNQIAETEIVRESGLDAEGVDNFTTLANDYKVE